MKKKHKQIKPAVNFKDLAPDVKGKAFLELLDVTIKDIYKLLQELLNRPI